jgi:hypothetical protein
MKTEEDEAFEAIERRQGGFQTKRAMAADKVQESSCKPVPKTEVLNTLVDLMNQAAQPAQEPVAWVTEVYGGRFTYEPINPAMVLPIGMALYAAPKGNT